MSTTWAERLEDGSGRDIRLYFTIQGIPHVFQTDVTDVPSTLETSTRPRAKVIKKGGIQQSPSVMNIAARRVEGGTLTIELVDDDDGTLVELFTPRRYRASFISANESAGDTTLSISAASTTIADADFIYVDAETIKVNSVGASSITCSRGQFGSVATPHYSNTDSGASVFTSPPAWEGRRVYLKSYFLNDDGSTSSALSRAEGTFRIEKAPSQTETGAWVIQCSELSDEFYQKKIGRGLRAVTIDSVLTTAGSTDNTRDLFIGEEAIQQFALGSSTFAQVICKNDGEAASCWNVVDVDTPGETITMGSQMVANTPAHWGGTVNVQHVAILDDNWASIMLKVLLSKLGDTANGSFDQLPGTERTSFASGFFQFGAGILEDEVDVLGFQIAGQAKNGRFVIDGERAVADAMFEFALATNSIPYTTRAGLLSARPLSSSSNATVMTVTESMFMEGSKGAVEYDEDVICPRVDLLCNYDVLTGKYAARFNTFDTELAARYPGKEKTLEIQSKSLCVDGYPFGASRVGSGVQEVVPTSASRMTAGGVETFLRQVQVSNGRGRAYLRGRWHMDLLALELGDLVQLQVNAVNLEGATSINQLARVVELGPDWNSGAVEASFELVDEVFVVAPACTIASAALAVLTLTLNTPEAAEPLTPGQMFADGAAVQIWDISAGSFVQRTVLSHTDTTITLSSAPGFAIEADVDLLRVDDQSLAADDENDDGFSAMNFIYQMPANENAADFVTRWR